MTRIAFAGDRQVAVDCLAFIQEQGAEVAALLVAADTKATHADRLRALAGLPAERVLVGTRFREPEAVEMLRGLELDYLVGIHFPYIVPEEVLAIPRVGAVNLHPALLPYNRGWHTASWALLDGTPAGVTLHFMDSGLDTGDIIAQAGLEAHPDDTAHSLYARLLDLELDLFRESWPLLASGDPPRLRQPSEEGTSHNRAALANDDVRRLDLGATETIADTLRRLRGLTTNDPSEAAYFELKGGRYRVQVAITPDEGDQSDPQLATNDG